MTNAEGEPRLMKRSTLEHQKAKGEMRSYLEEEYGDRPLLASRAQVYHFGETSAIQEQVRRMADSMDLESAQPVPVRPGDIITISGLPKTDGEYVVATGGVLHTNVPLRDDDPVHTDPDPDEDEIPDEDPLEDEADGVPGENTWAELQKHLSEGFATIALSPEQNALLQKDLNKLYKISDRQREVLARFERRVRGY